MDAATEKKLLKMKGGLISEGFTDIIHIEDDGPDFYINYFTANTHKKQEAIDYIDSHIIQHALNESVSLVL